MYAHHTHTRARAHTHTHTHTHARACRWHDESSVRAVCLRLLPDTSVGHADRGWQGSGAVSVETIGYSPLKVRAAKRNEGEGLASTNLMIHTEVQGSVTVLTVHPQAASNTALEVCNHSSVVTVCFRQTQVPQELEEAAAPGAAAPGTAALRSATLRSTLRTSRCTYSSRRWRGGRRRTRCWPRPFRMRAFAHSSCRTS